MLPECGGWWGKPPESVKDARKRARLLHRRLVYCAGCEVEPSLSSSKSGWFSLETWPREDHLKVLVIVTHGLFFDHVLQVILDVNLRSPLTRECNFMLDNWACTALEFLVSSSNGRDDPLQSVSLQCHNFSCYLPADLHREQRMKDKFRSFIR
eukprot:Blabericola_migrator_1__5613@NODE_2855_length_2281_cov_166_275519_g1791_i0_p2_GENE_NODE_2855_length_2281_cov_166_275519_g1791_i0NODE_2855_length_2281_cov_166_275519_g1791_i0_p2_ORF_typecomplete_len153_score11_68His_Phos_1/PF00300_22/0_13_NODE_2855_length_2281_cov_166_275519_g1791_i0408866